MAHSRSTKRTSPCAPVTCIWVAIQHDHRHSTRAEQEGTSGLGAFKSVEEVAKKTKNVRLRAHLFDSTVIPALTYASETWAIRKQDEHAISVAQRGIERTMLGVTRLTQVREGLRSSELRRRLKIRDAVA
ncbi:unnamed protein product [Heligmosomoides polygyrus]|uniref:Reverse transcriptase domain-containing protein n=1 Tax=Heligmosomoides polygyrus TaxID=6339 RepID=A0A183FWA5_HELPZ|nr:unnamed protein product [Heligmosomoides polygyrus]